MLRLLPVRHVQKAGAPLLAIHTADVGSIDQSGQSSNTEGTQKTNRSRVDNSGISCSRTLHRPNSSLQVLPHLRAVHHRDTASVNHTVSDSNSTSVTTASDPCSYTYFLVSPVLPCGLYTFLSVPETRSYCGAWLLQLISATNLHLASLPNCHL